MEQEEKPTSHRSPRPKQPGHQTQRFHSNDPITPLPLPLPRDALVFSHHAHDPFPSFLSFIPTPPSTIFIITTTIPHPTCFIASLLIDHLSGSRLSKYEHNLPHHSPTLCRPSAALTTSSTRCIRKTTARLWTRDRWLREASL